MRRLEASVERRGYPRTAVALIVALAALASVVVSIILLQLGLTHMGVRYLVCLAFAYLVFLALLRLLASRHAEHLDPVIDLPVPGGGSGGGSGGSSVEPFSGGGGEFGGGGASANWGPADSVDAGDASSSIADGVSGIDLDDGWVVAIPVVILAGALFAGGYVVTIAPVLVAEVVLDVAIAAGAYRAATRLNPQHWALGVVRRTWLAALGFALVVGGIGFGLQAMAPDAHTIGAALSRR